MRSTSALYRFACEEEGCVSHTELVKLFHGVDVALQANAPALPQQGTPFSEEDKFDEDDLALLSPPPPALTDHLLIAFTPDLRYPTHITLSATYLGDAGAAAFFRVLPMLRWLRVVEARGIGAGSRSINALCSGLTSYLVDGCEEAPALPVGAAQSFSSEKSGDAMCHPLAGRLPALEVVDLRDNDAIFSLAVEQLLSVLRRRRAELLRWCAKQGETAPEGVVLPALAVYINLQNLLPSTARSLTAWNAEATAIQRHRDSAAEERRWQAQLRVFTAPKDGAESSCCAQPVGEHVVFRLPLQQLDHVQDSQALSVEDELRVSINAHMRQFLQASCMLAPTSDEAASRSVYAAAEGSYAALQACVDFGTDALDVLPYSNAALWFAARTSQQQQQRPKMKFLEAQHNVGALLRTLETASTLESELVASETAGGVVVERHLGRLRELYKELQSATSELPMSDERYEETVRLYGRVVAAMVTPRFSEQHLPSMAMYEHHIKEVAEYTLGHLVVGENNAAVLTEMLCRLRESVQERLSLPQPDKGRLADDDEDGERTRLLPPIMAACFYHVQRHRAEERAWMQTYAGASEAVRDAATSSCPALSGIPETMQAFHRCSCGVAAREQGTQGDSEGCKDGTASLEETSGCPAPCTTCSYRALKLVEDALARSVFGEEWRVRWAMQHPVHQALPRSIRMFLLDVVVRQRSRAQGGCAYVPPLHLLKPYSDNEDRDRWSMAAWLACPHHQEAYWVEVLRVFSQWYRLRIVESFGHPEALALFQSTK